MNPTTIVDALLEADEDIRRLARSGIEHLHIQDEFRKFLEGLGLEVVNVEFHNFVERGRFFRAWAFKGPAPIVHGAQELRAELISWLNYKFPNYEAVWVGHSDDSGGWSPLFSGKPIRIEMRTRTKEGGWPIWQNWENPPDRE